MNHVSFKFCLRAVCLLFANCVVGFLPQSAQAGLILSFSPDGNLNPQFTVLQGSSSQALSVYLVPTSGETRLDTIGLFAGGASITLETGSGLSTYNSGSATYESHWTDPEASFARYQVPHTRVELQGLRDGTPLMAASGGSIKIGSFTVLGGNEGSITNLSLSLVGLVDDAILLDDFTSFQPLNADPNNLIFGSATILAVPEPSALWSVGCASLLMFGVRRKRNWGAITRRARRS